MLYREKLLQRQESGRFMGCGSSQHKIGACPKRKSGYRPPTPNEYGKQKSVRFSAVDNAPLPFGREGDVDDDPEYIVDF